MLKIRYGICYSDQKLYSGTWGALDCVWDWEDRWVMYPSREKAEAAFKKLRVTDNTPIIRLYEVRYDEYGVDDRIILDEIN